MTTVDVKDVGTIDFPDSMSQEQIGDVLRRKFAKPAAKPDIKPIDYNDPAFTNQSMANLGKMLGVDPWQSQPTIAPLKGLDKLTFNLQRILNKAFPGYAEKATPSPFTVVGQSAMLAPVAMPEKLATPLFAYFAARTAAEQPAIAAQIRDEIKSGDYSGAQRTAIEDALQLGIIGAGGYSMRTESRLTRNVSDAGAPATAKVLDDTLKTEPTKSEPILSFAEASEQGPQAVKAIMQKYGLSRDAAVALQAKSRQIHGITKKVAQEPEPKPEKTAEATPKPGDKINYPLVGTTGTVLYQLTTTSPVHQEPVTITSIEHGKVGEKTGRPTVTIKLSNGNSVSRVYGKDKYGDTKPIEQAISEGIKGLRFTPDKPSEKPAEPPKVVGASFTNPKTGETTVAPTHIEAAAKQGVEAPKPRQGRETEDYGFAVKTPEGKTEVVSREEAKPIAEQAGQIKKPVEPGKPLHSDNVEMAKPGGGESTRTPEEQAKSRKNNSRAAFEAAQKKAGLPPLPSATAKPEGAEKPKFKRADSTEFDKLVLEYGPQAGWTQHANVLYDPTIMAKGQQGSGGIQARILRSKEMAVARRQAAKALGVAPDAAETMEGRAALLGKLKEHVEAEYKLPEKQNQEFAEASQKRKKEVPVSELKIGDVLNIDGEPVKVTDVTAEGDVILDDGKRFGRQILFDDTTIYAEDWSTEEGGTKEPFNLEEPETTDEQRVRMAKEQEERMAKEAAEAKAEKIRAKAAAPLGGNLGSAGQGGLFVEPGEQEMFQPKARRLSMGPGAKTIGEPKKPELAQLTDSIKTMAEQKGEPAKLSTAFDMGRAAENVKDGVSEFVTGLKAAGDYMKQRLIGRPVWTSYKAALGDRHLALSQSAQNARAFVKSAEKAVPKKLAQEAISNWIDTGGSTEVLDQAAATTKPRYKRGYMEAKKLTPEQMTLAQNVKNYFDARLQDAIDAGVLEDGIEDYIHRIYESDSPWKQSIMSELRSGVFTGRPALAKQRVYQYDFEAEQKGLRPVKSFAKRVAAYDLSLNKAIADRQLVKDMMGIKMPDGRPMVDVGGIGTQIEGEAGKGGATFIKPHFKPFDDEDPENNRQDFKSYDYPALRKWKWVSKDKDGNNIFVQGDVLVHPDAIKDVRALFERSKIRQNPVGRAGLALSSTIKQTMLDLSGFHPVQIAVHGWEHRTFKPVEKIDFDNEDVRGLIRGGLVVGETTGRELFSEGLSGSSLTKFIPGVGPKMNSYHDWLFNSFIPRLKVATGLHALERNRAKYGKSLSSDELYHLTANEMNGAFGELNYAMLGRSQTTQDALRLAFLAPDFLEARGRFTAQAGTKYGNEQFTALALGAATLYIGARIINKMLTGEYHMEPKNAFSIVYNKKAYSLRTVQGDLLRLMTEPGQFLYSRLNPTYGRTLLEFANSRDYFGRKRSGFEQLKDFAETVVPISLRGAINPREQNLWESFLNAFGFMEHRSTASDDVYQLVDNFKKAHNIRSEPGEFIYDPDKDPYRGIKSAATFSAPATAAKEMAKAVKKGDVTEAQIRKYFKTYTTRPFTGSQKDEAMFVRELSDENRKIYSDAIAERAAMRKNLAAAWEIYDKTKLDKTANE